jgi:HK97 gp10 family phage protein
VSIDAMAFFGNAFAKLKNYLGGNLDAKMDAAGKAWVQESRRLAHVQTGHMRDSIGYTYRQSDKTLQLHADAKYSVFEEYGSRFREPHPFMRPAIKVVNKALGVSIEFQFANVPPTRTQPTPKGMERIKRNEKFNAALDVSLGKKSPTVVFFGTHPGSKRGFKVPFKHVVKYK